MPDYAFPLGGASGIVMAGVAAYRNMPPLPAALNNLIDLRSAFGAVFPDEAIHTVADPQTPNEVLDLVAYAKDRYVDTIVFYFAGHGVRDADDQLCLALPSTVDTKADAQRTALSVERVVAALGTKARKRVVILDCCFSGRVLQAPSAYGLHLLTATDQTKKALSPEGQRNTLFTGAVLDLLRNGIPDAGEWITVGDLYRWARGGPDDPVPHQRCVDDSALLALARNVGSRQDFARRAHLATAVGWKDPARAARLFDRLAAEANGHVAPQDVATYQMSAAAFHGAAGDPVVALSRWQDLRRDPCANQEDVEANISYWSSKLSL